MNISSLVFLVMKFLQKTEHRHQSTTWNGSLERRINTEREKEDQRLRFYLRLNQKDTVGFFIWWKIATSIQGFQVLLKEGQKYFLLYPQNSLERLHISHLSKSSIQKSVYFDILLLLKIKSYVSSTLSTAKLSCTYWSACTNDVNREWHMLCKSDQKHFRGCSENMFFILWKQKLSRFSLDLFKCSFNLNKQSFVFPQATLQVGGHGERICQCRQAVITTTKAIPMQVDGEPCRLRASKITISRRNQARIVMKSKRRMSLSRE